MREPLESKYINISRAAHQVKFPAKFQLVTAMNPCPCGYHGDHRANCNCTPDQIRRYRTRVSGPFLDRIDLWVLVSSLTNKVLTHPQTPITTSAEAKARVVKARKYAISRAGKINSELTNREIEKFCSILPSDQNFLENLIEKL